MKISNDKEVTARRYREQDAEEIVGVGSIASYWGSLTELRFRHPSQRWSFIRNKAMSTKMD